MNPTELASNPFALMMDPQAVLTALEQSTRLAQLKRRICRPLDKGAGGSSIQEEVDVESAASEFDAGASQFGVTESGAAGI